MNKRLKELDSLRGLAALTVVMHHYLLVFPTIVNAHYNQSDNLFITLIKFTPFHIFWAGHEAVIFFFILSGFVLSLPFYNSIKEFQYSTYIIKRICRIYIPYIVAVTIAIGMYYLTYKGGISELSSWFNSRKNTIVDLNLILNHFILIGSFKNGIFNPVLWSLVQEMRISILFPFLMYLVLKYNWKKNILIGISLSLFSFCVNYILERFTKIQNDYFSTFHYMSLFILGALMAKYRNKYISFFNKQSRITKYALFVAATLFYTNGWYLSKIRIFQVDIVNDLCIAIGVALFIILGLTSTAVSKILLNKYIHFIGKISYSLYLYHSIWLLTLINVFYTILPIFAILSIAFIVTLITSVISYYIIEVSAMNLGKLLAEKIQRTYSSTTINE